MMDGMVVVSTVSRTFDAERYFFRQVFTLLKRGYHEALGLKKLEFMNRLESARLQVVEMRETIERAALKDSGLFPFILVLPSSVMPVADQITRIETEDGKRGTAHFGVDVPNAVLPSQFRDEAYIVLDVEDGTETKGLFAAQCKKMFVGNHIRELTLEEGIAMVTQFPWVLKDHGIYLISSYNHRGYFASISETEQSVRVAFSHPFNRDPEWGFPSCLIETGRI